MASAHFYAIRCFLDVIMAFAPKAARSQKKKNVAIPSKITGECEHPRERVDIDISGWTPRKIVSGDGSVTHHYYHHRSERNGAPTIVLLHGMFMNGRFFANFRSLAADYELIAYDFPQEWQGYKEELDDFITLLEDFTARIELGSFILAGVSFGGMVALRWAALLPAERLRALILIATRIPGITPEERRQSLEVKALIDRYSDEHLKWFQRWAFALFPLVFRGQKREMIKAALQLKSISYYRQAFTAVADRNGREDATKIRVPVLYLLGTKDPLFPQKSAVEIQEAIPQAQVEFVQGGQHVMAFLEGEKISCSIQRFLKDLFSVAP